MESPTEKLEMEMETEELTEREVTPTFPESFDRTSTTTSSTTTNLLGALVYV